MKQSLQIKRQPNWGQIIIFTFYRKRLFESIPKTVWHLDEPVADPSTIALYHLNQLAKEHVTVVLSGEGADELFGGYRIYREPNALRPITRMPNFIKDSLRKSLSVYPYHFYGKNYLLRGLTPLEERFSEMLISLTKAVR